MNSTQQTKLPKPSDVAVWFEQLTDFEKKKIDEARIIHRLYAEDEKNDPIEIIVVNLIRSILPKEFNK